MSVSKDFIKFRQHLRTLNLSVNEQYLMELFFEYNNSKFGYSFLDFAGIMKAFNTTSKNRISTTIKKLEKKALIEVDRSYKNNRYKIIGIDNFTNTNPVDSNGKSPLDGQIHFSEITEEEKEIIDLGFTQKQAKSLLQVAKDKVEKVIQSFNYATGKGANNLYAYTLWAINNITKIKNTFKQAEDQDGWNPKTKFDNFKPREYDWNLLEKKLLGWE